jgi:hypothetical protein
MQADLFDSFILGVRGAVSLSARQKVEVEEHLEAISARFAPFSLVNPQTAESIANFLACALYESTRRDRSTTLAAHARKGMLLAFRAAEETDPQLAARGYALGDVLSALGI